MNLLIIGAPGTGKGTMSGLIVEKYHVVHVSTGDMLRDAVANKTEVGLKANEFMQKGELVPDSVIHDIITEWLSNADLSNGFLFDGYPRSKAQAEDLDEILKGLNMKIDHVINLELDEELLKSRITGRRICKNCKEIYHIVTNKPAVEGVCDKCGGELYQRKDDTLESLITRLDAYHKSTEPVIEFYDKMNLVSSINADQSIDGVFDSIKAVVGGVNDND